jgi:hypothetical protein
LAARRYHPFPFGCLLLKRSGVLSSTTRARCRILSPRPRATTPPLPRRQTRPFAVRPRCRTPPSSAASRCSKSRSDNCAVLTLPALFPAGRDTRHWLSPPSGFPHPSQSRPEPVEPHAGPPSCCSRTTYPLVIVAPPISARGSKLPGLARSSRAASSSSSSPCLAIQPQKEPYPGLLGAPKTAHATSQTRPQQQTTGSSRLYSVVAASRRQTCVADLVLRKRRLVSYIALPAPDRAQWLLRHP